MYIRDRGQKIVRKGQKHKVGQSSLTGALACMSTVVRFCPHCMGLRNMRTTQESRRGAGNKNREREFIATHHCETCGLFVEDRSFRPASWDDLINSLGRFSTDFMAERRQPKLQK